MKKIHLGLAPWVSMHKKVLAGTWSVKGGWRESENPEYVTVGSVWGAPRWPHPGL